MSYDEEYGPWGALPECPWCGEEVTDDPRDFDMWGEAELDCGGCGQPVMVQGETTTRYRAKKAEPWDQ